MWVCVCVRMCAYEQDAFCGTAGCAIQRIFDQSPKQNHLDPAPGGEASHHADLPVNATRLPVCVRTCVCACVRVRHHVLDTVHGRVLGSRGDGRSLFVCGCCVLGIMPGFGA